MIDLRSDTLTLPNLEMLEKIPLSKFGDSSRLNELGRGEDETVLELEELAAKLTGKEESLLFPTGTLANTTAILTYCIPGDLVLVEETQHIYVTEKIVFEENFGRLKPITYKLNEKFVPDVKELESLLLENDVKLICLENSHNFSGGYCIDMETLKSIYSLAKEYEVHVHMDGARLFNAAEYLDVSVDEICKYTDSVMFCLSKGLGAPMGSLLCSSKEFLREVKVNKKKLGGNMRQAGLIAAPGIYALNNNLKHIKEDNLNARIFSEKLKKFESIYVEGGAQTNIVMANISRTGISNKEFCRLAKEKGLLIRPIFKDEVRFVFYNNILNKDIEKIIEIIQEIEDELSLKK